MAQVYLSQYSKRAALADTSTSASYAATASYISPIKLDPVQDPDPTGLLYPSSTYLFQSSSNTFSGYDLYFRQDGNLVKWKWIEGMLNTGLLYGGVLSYSASSFLITPGSGIIVNHNAVTGSEISPVVDYVTWGPITQSVENIAAYQNTFVYIDSNGNANQQNVFFTPEQYQIYIPIGRISHYDNVVTNGSNTNDQTVYDADGQQNIFVRAFGPLKLTGIATSGQTSTLRLNIGSGRAFNLGGYYPYNPEMPSTYDMSTYNTASIIRIYRSGSGYKFDNNGGSYYTTINPGNYDNGTGILASVGNSEWTIQRVMVNPITGRAHVYYGQNKYNTYDDAVGSISSDAFVESDATANSYPLSAYLIVKGNTTDLTNTVENKIVQAGLFRSIAGGGATGGGGIPGGQNTQIQFNNAGVFDGNPNFTYNYLNSSLTLTGSMFVSGAISASFGNNTIGFFGTASWAVSASQAISASKAFSSSYALSASRATTASYALTASFATTSSYASASPNFANTDLVFTDNRKHSTNNYSYFIYSNIVGGNPSNPFDGIGVSGSFYFFNSSSNALGTAAGSTNTYTYIEITTQSIDLSFDANPVVPSSYTFTKNSASFSSSLTVTKSVYFPGLTTTPQSNVVIIDTTNGQLYYTASSAIGGAANVGILNEGSSITPAVTSIDFVGAGVTATAIGNAVTVTIPGGGTGAPGGQNTQIQFNSGSSFSGSRNFIFDYTSNIVRLTGSMIVSGSTRIINSLTVTGSLIVNDGTYDVLDTTQWILKDSTGQTSVDWNGKTLKDGNRTPVDWANRYLQSSNADELSVDWENRVLYASDGTTAHLDWSNPSYISLPNINTSPITNVLGIDGGGRVYYTASSAIGGGGGNAFPYNGNAIITGSLLVSQSGIIVTGSISSTAGFTGSLFGTASYVTGSIFTSTNQALSASFAVSSSRTVTASFAITSSYITGSIFTSTNPALSASYALSASQALTASFASTASYVTGSIFTSTNPALSASYALSSSNALTASFVVTASYVTGSIFTSTNPALSASFALSSSRAVTASLALTASFVVTASYVTGSIFTNVNPALSASYALTASFIQTAQTASYVTGSIFTSTNPALSSSYALTASFSPNFANTNLTLTSDRTHTGGGNEYRFFHSGSAANYRGGNQFIRSNEHVLGAREPKGGGAYETAFIQMTTSSLTIGVGDELNATFGLRQLTVTTSSVTITGSLLVSGSVQSTQGFTGSLFGTASWATNALTASFVTPYEGAWTSYTPVWTTDGVTQPVIGNGSLTGAYKQIGKTVFVRVKLNCGSSTTFGTGAFLFSLPVTASNADGIQFPCSMLDNGVAWYQGTVNGTYSGFTNRSAIIAQSAGGVNSSQGVFATFPFTWGSTDSLQFNGSYEAA